MANAHTHTAREESSESVRCDILLNCSTDCSPLLVGLGRIGGWLLSVKRIIALGDTVCERESNCKVRERSVCKKRKSVDMERTQAKLDGHLRFIYRGALSDYFGGFKLKGWYVRMREDRYQEIPNDGVEQRK